MGLLLMLKHTAICGTARTPIATNCEHSAGVHSNRCSPSRMHAYGSAKWGGAAVGFLSMIVDVVDPIEHRPGGALIPRVYIIGPTQRTGLGRLLLDAAIERAGTEGLSHIWLDVMASATAAARRAYARWGFREIGRRRYERPVKADLSEWLS